MSFTSPKTEAEQEATTSRDRVRAWLIAHEYSVEEKSQTGQCWTLESFDSGRAFGFWANQPIDHPDIVVLSATFNFAGFQRELDLLPFAERSEFIFDLWFRLLQLDMEFRALGDPLNGIVLHAHVYIDGGGLRRGEFWRNLRTLRRAYWACKLTFEKKFKRTLSLPPTDVLDTVM